MLTKDEIEALMARREALVKLFDARIAQRGEKAVLYTLSR
jgi:Trp operon repressor